ncbi:MAG: hypothetical protein OEM02_17110 [Desulfobulbaceae bacterium]|nr:hypothetical protein [Desulfobulbaceae bacterium]
MIKPSRSDIKSGEGRKLGTGEKRKEWEKRMGEKNGRKEWEKNGDRQIIYFGNFITVDRRSAAKIPPTEHFDSS